MFRSPFVVFALVLLGIYVANILLTRKQKYQAPLPPGPKPLPIVGNIADLPPSGEQEWTHWLKYKKLYGPISSVTVLGQTLVILNESRMAFELMEKRSALHSSRPRMVFGGEMCGWEHALSSQTYSDRWRAYRKAARGLLGSKWVVARFHELQDVEVRRFLLRIYKRPEDLVQHIRTEAGAIILKIAYGYNIEQRKRDPLVDLADKALEQFSAAVQPGAWLVDIMPSLMYLPGWLPGTGFKRTAKVWKSTLTDLVEKPYAFVKQQMKEGKNEPSYLSSLLEKGGKTRLSEEDDFVAKWSSGSLYAGGADTTVSTIACFFLAMTLFPDVQRKAQEEIDRVVGAKRLPNFDDRENLVYIEAIVKEALRWHPVAPLGLPHMSTEDNIYEGYLIPKGALIIANIWAFTHDPSTYPDPDKFRPERFLKTEGHEPEPDPHTLSFGFGRRICPGRVLADESVYLSIAQSLAVFNIGKPLDEKGDTVEPNVRFQPGIISHPAPFQASIKPRSEEYERLIRSVEVEHPVKESDAEILQSMEC